MIAVSLYVFTPLPFGWILLLKIVWWERYENAVTMMIDDFEREPFFSLSQNEIASMIWLLSNANYSGSSNKHQQYTKIEQKQKFSTIQSFLVPIFFFCSFFANTVVVHNMPTQMRHFSYEKHSFWLKNVNIFKFKNVHWHLSQLWRSTKCALT